MIKFVGGRQTRPAHFAQACPERRPPFQADFATHPRWQELVRSLRLVAGDDEPEIRCEERLRFGGLFQRRPPRCDVARHDLTGLDS